MTKAKTALLVSLALLLLLLALAVYADWPRSHGPTDIQVLQTRKSPNDKWTAVVQQEVYGGALAASDYPVYAVRLIGPMQKDRQGDAVMYAEAAYPGPRPFVSWEGDKLIVTLLDHEKYQYFMSPVDGVFIDVQRK